MQTDKFFLVLCKNFVAFFHEQRKETVLYCYFLFSRFYRLFRKYFEWLSSIAPGICCLWHKLYICLMLIDNYHNLHGKFINLFLPRVVLLLKTFEKYIGARVGAKEMKNNILYFSLTASAKGNIKNAFMKVYDWWRRRPVVMMATTTELGVTALRFTLKRIKRIFAGLCDFTSYWRDFKPHENRLKWNKIVTMAIKINFYFMRNATRRSECAIDGRQQHFSCMLFFRFLQVIFRCVGPWNVH